MKSKDISTIKELYNLWYNKKSIRSLIGLFEEGIASIISDNEVKDQDTNTIITKWVEYLLDRGKLGRYLTSWLQWDIYIQTIPLPEWDRKILIIKKQTWNSYVNEQEQQIKAMNIFKDHDTIWVPKLYGSKSYVKLNENNHSYTESYLYMDYVPWKTLYCCLIEQLVEDYYNKYKELFPENFIIRYQNDFHDNNKIAHRRFFDFSNDALASSAIIEIIEILEKQWIHTHYHNIEQRKSSQKPHLTIMNYILDQDNIKLFEDKDKKWIDDVTQGIKYMNDSWLYHRDLWENTRNIIVWSDNKCYLIDFGLATWKSWEEDPFREEYEDKITIYQHDADATSKMLNRHLW